MAETLWKREKVTRRSITVNIEPENPESLKTKFGRKSFFLVTAKGRCVLDDRKAILLSG
jgi:hypothetical protein